MFTNKIEYDILMKIKNEGFVLKLKNRKTNPYEAYLVERTVEENEDNK